MMAISPRAGLLALLAALMLPPAQAARIALEKSSCALTPELAPRGAAYDPVEDRLMVVSGRQRATLVALNEDCTVTDAIELEATGVTAPTGIAYAAAVGGYVLVDDADDTLVLIDNEGAALGSCSLAALGLSSPSAITARDTDTYAVADDQSAEFILVDLSILNGSSCHLVDRFDGTRFGAEHPVSIEYVPTRGEYIVAEESSLTVHVVDEAFELIDTGRFEGDSEGNGGFAYVPASDSLFSVRDGSAPRLTALDVNGTLVPRCDLQDFASTRPQAITFVPTRNELAFTDQAAKRLYFVDADTCALNRAIDTDALGIGGAAGIAYRPAARQLVIADVAQIALYFVAYDSGQVEQVCDLAPLGFSSPSAVAAVPGLDLINVIDQINNTLVTLDANCDLQRQYSLALTPDAPPPPVDAVAYGTGAAVTLVSGRLTNEIFVLNNGGGAERQFNVNAGSAEITGLASLGDGRRFLLLDFTRDEVLTLDMPILTTALGISGTFADEGANVRLVLHERGKGRLTGAAQVAGAVLPAYGQFDRASGTIVIAYTPLEGDPVVTVGTVTPDLDTITSSGPLGTLQRTY